MPTGQSTLKQSVLRELRQLRPSSTMCPGMLARRQGMTLSALRPTLHELEQAGEIQVLQKGEVIPLEEVKGPFRVRLPASG